MLRKIEHRTSNIVRPITTKFKIFQVNGNMASYASIAASTKEPPQLLSPMVFTGQNQPQQPQKDLCNKSKPKSADLGKQTVAPTQQQQPPQVNLPTPQVQLNFR